MTQPPLIIGIDLGTTRSIVAHVDRSDHATCFPDRHGEVFVDSCVSIKDDRTVVVGHGARPAPLRTPNRSVAAFNDHD